MLDRYRRPDILLLLMAAAVPLSFSTWSALINNFAVERAAARRWRWLRWGVRR